MEVVQKRQVENIEETVSTDESLEDVSVGRFTRRRDAKMQRSQDSGAMTDCSSSDSGHHSPLLSGGKYVTVLSVNGGLTPLHLSPTPTTTALKDHVTVVSIGSEDEVDSSSSSGVCLSLLSGFVEEVACVKRGKPGQKLGFGLKFDAAGQLGQQRLFIQCCAKETPADTMRCSWGKLVEADEIIQIDGLDVAQLSRLDVVRQLTEGSNDQVLRLKIRHYWDDKQRVAIIQQLNSVVVPTPTVQQQTYSKPQERAVDVPEEFLMRGRKDVAKSQEPVMDDTPPVPPRRRRRSSSIKPLTATATASAGKEKASRSLSSDEVLVNGQRVSATPSKPPRSGRLQASRSFGPSTPNPKTTLPASWNEPCSLPVFESGDAKDASQEKQTIPKEVEVIDSDVMAANTDVISIATTTTTTTTVCELLLIEPPATFLDVDASYDTSLTELMTTAEPMPDTSSDSGASSGDSELLLNLLAASDSCASTLDGSDTEAEQLIAFQRVEQALESGMFEDDSVADHIQKVLPAQHPRIVDDEKVKKAPATTATQRSGTRLKPPTVSATLRSTTQQQRSSTTAANTTAPTKREIAVTKIPTLSRSRIPQAVASVSSSSSLQPSRTITGAAASSSSSTTTKNPAASAVTTGLARPAANNKTRSGIVPLARPVATSAATSTTNTKSSSSSSSVKSGLAGQQQSRIPRFNSTNNINKSSNSIHQVKSYNKLKGESSTTTNNKRMNNSKRSSSNNNLVSAH